MYGGLPFTGAGLLVFGHIIGADTVVGTGLALVLGGVAVVRLATRHQRVASK